MVINIKKHFFILSAILSFFIGTTQSANAMCSMDSITECDRQGLVSLITEIIKSRQIKRPLASNEFTVDKMKKRLNQYVGGMKLVSIDSRDKNISFKFQGPIKLNADYSNEVTLSPELKEGEYHSIKKRCFYNISPEDLRLLPTLVMPSDDTYTMQEYLCLDGNTKELEGVSFANADIEISELIITVVSDKNFTDEICDTMSSYVSKISIDRISDLRIRKYEDKSTWKSLSYQFPDSSGILTFKINPDYVLENHCIMSHGSNYSICARANYYRCEAGIGGEMIKSLEIYTDDSGLSAEEYSHKYFNIDNGNKSLFYGLDAYYEESDPMIGYSVVINKGIYYIRVTGVQWEELDDVLLISNESI